MPQNGSGRSFNAESEKELEKEVVRERTFKVENEVLYFARYEGAVPVATEEFAYRKIP